ncbi:MAG TPA: hypothetical protein VHY79_00425 [Rhizomicrobium sp.]|nr:hypothetical protein [Rhizomicrobium sp.]
MKELAGVLKQIRQHVTKNDTRMAEIIGVSAHTISQIYLGQNRPRYQTFMRMIDGAIALCERPKTDDDLQASLNIFMEPSIEEVAELAEWRMLHVCQLQKKISGPADVLEQVLFLCRGSNDASTLGLTDIQKHQLVAMLETALATLKAPMVELSLLRRIGRWMQKVAGGAVTHGLATALEASADKVDMTDACSFGSKLK